jgi:hypothetical protein
MAAPLLGTRPLRGTQSLIGQMGWVFARPSLTAIEVAWRCAFALPFAAVCWQQARQIVTELPLESTGLASIDPQNPWVAAVQLANAWALYEPRVAAVLRWLLPMAALAWAVVSGLGRSLVLHRLSAGNAITGKDNIPGPKRGTSTPRTWGTQIIPTYVSQLSGLRILEMIVLQAAWFALLGATCWGWFRSIEWAAATHITAFGLPNQGEPDLIGYSIWVIFLSLGFFTLWALVSWAFAIAPLLMLFEERSVLGSLGQSFRLGKAFTGKLVEINLVMGIVKLALIVLAMVLSAAPLPFSDQLGPNALHGITALAATLYFVAGDYFEVVRLKGFQEFWKLHRAPR